MSPTLKDVAAHGVQSDDLFFCPGRSSGNYWSRDATVNSAYGSWNRDFHGASTANHVRGGYLIATSDVLVGYLAQSYTKFGSWHVLQKGVPDKPLAFDWPYKSRDITTVSVPNGATATRHGGGRGINFVFYDGSARTIRDPAGLLETREPTGVYVGYTGTNRTYFTTDIMRTIFGWSTQMVGQHFPSL